MTASSSSNEWIKSTYPSSNLWSTLKADLIRIPQLDKNNIEEFMQLLINCGYMKVKSEKISAISILEFNGNPKNIIRNIDRTHELDEQLTTENYLSTLQGSNKQILDRAQQLHPYSGDLLNVISFLEMARLPLDINLIVNMTAALQGAFISHEQILAIRRSLGYFISRGILKISNMQILPEENIINCQIDFVEYRSALSRNLFFVPIELLSEEFISSIINILITGQNRLFIIRWNTIKTMLLILRWSKFYNKTKPKPQKEIIAKVKKRIGFLQRFKFRMHMLGYYLTSMRILLFSNLSSIDEVEEFTLNFTSNFLIDWENMVRHVEFVSGLPRSELGFGDNDFSVSAIAQFAILKAGSAIKKGWFEYAESLLLPYVNISNYPIRTRALQLSGYANIFREKWEKAYELFQLSRQSIIIGGPNEFSTNIGLAWSLSHISNREKANEIFYQIIENKKIKPYDQFDTIALAALYSLRHEFDKAIKIIGAMQSTRSTLKLVEVIPELANLRDKIATRLERPEFLPNARIFRLKRKPWIYYWSTFFPTLSLVILFILFQGEPQLKPDLFLEYSFVIMITLTMINAYQKAIRRKQRDEFYRLILLPNRLEYTEKFEKTFKLNYDQITEIEEDSARRPPFSFTLST